MRALILALLLLAPLHAEEPAIGLSPLQQAQVRVLQLETENMQLRQAVLSLQVQLESLKAPQEAQQRELKWKQLESQIGCPLDRPSGTVKCPHVNKAEPSPKATP